jgi:hypothetical protein|tara:strand:+ start:207 stop:416 length:210 start_codon:yes stop_codon:yes gene_type:complete
MNAQFKKKNFLLEVNQEPLKVKAKSVRPDIDHLIKRIMNERRKQERKNLLVFTGALLLVGGFIISSLYS